MGCLPGRGAAVRTDPRLLLASARSIIGVGKLYNGPEPRSTEMSDAELGWVSRYAWGEDYHGVVQKALEELVGRLGLDHEWKICVDTARLLERSYAREAGLGWFGKNTCLINPHMGSWSFLGEILTSMEIEPDMPPPDRCGTCTRCIDACPTQAIPASGYEIDARRCIPYFTIELHGAVPEEMRSGIDNHVFAGDISQRLCPGHRHPPLPEAPSFSPPHSPPPSQTLSALPPLHSPPI